MTPNYFKSHRKGRVKLKTSKDGKGLKDIKRLVRTEKDRKGQKRTKGLVRTEKDS